MTKCPHCGHTFRNLLLKTRCPNCSRLLSDPRPRESDNDEGFDATGFALGAAAGVPFGPRGVTVGAMLGAALHDPGPAASRDRPVEAPDAPPPAPEPEPAKGEPEKPAPADAPAAEAPSYSAPDPSSPSSDFGGGGSSD